MTDGIVLQIISCNSRAKRFPSPIVIELNINMCDMVRVSIDRLRRIGEIGEVIGPDCGSSLLRNNKAEAAKRRRGLLPYYSMVESLLKVFGAR